MEASLRWHDGIGHSLTRRLAPADAGLPIPPNAPGHRSRTDCGTPSPGLSARSMADYSSQAYQASRPGRGPGRALAIAANVLLALPFLTKSSYSPLQRTAQPGWAGFNVPGSRPADEPPEKKAEPQPRPKQTAPE